jgi:hypothetical protein
MRRSRSTPEMIPVETLSSEEWIRHRDELRETLEKEHGWLTTTLREGGYEYALVHWNLLSNPEDHDSDIELRIMSDGNMKAVIRFARADIETEVPLRSVASSEVQDLARKFGLADFAVERRARAETQAPRI